jgi:hypothetical protein
LLDLEFLLATLVFSRDRGSRWVRERFVPAHSVIRVSASAAFLLCQGGILRQGRILILVTTNIPLVIVVYLFIVSPYCWGITVNL